MDIIKVCILILASILIGMFIAGILITLALNKLEIERFSDDEKILNLVTLAKFDVLGDEVYVINAKTFWDYLDLMFYFMFARFFYKSPLIWKKEKRTKIYLSISITLLILLFGFAIF